jgi:hypothetical protein
LRAPVALSLRIRCRDGAEAQRLLRSVAPDDPGSVGLTVEGADLALEVRSATALGALRTVDDVLGCLRAAEPDL